MRRRTWIACAIMSLGLPAWISLGFGPGLTAAVLAGAALAWDSAVGRRSA